MSSVVQKWQNPYLKNWLLPAGLLATIMLVDLYFTPGAITTPTCNFLALVMLAFILPRVPMILWACVYSLATVFTLYHPEIFRPAPNQTHITIIRSMGACFGASAAVALCFYRLKSARKSEQLNLLVKEIPVPFVLSDGNGEIILVNKQALQLLGVTASIAEGNSYFSLLTDASQKGNSIQKYLEIFETKEAREYALELKPKNNPGVVLHGTVIPADGVGGRYLITIISEPALA